MTSHFLAVNMLVFGQRYGIPLASLLIILSSTGFTGTQDDVEPTSFTSATPPTAAPVCTCSATSTSPPTFPGINAGNFSIPPFNTTCKDRTNTTLHCKPKSFHALEWHVYNLDFIHCKSGGVTNSNGSTLTLMCGAYEVRCLYQVNETSYRSEVVYVSKDKLIFEPNNVTCVHDDMIFHCATDRYDDIVSVTWHIGEDVADDNLISCDGLQLKLPCNLTYDGARVRCTVKLRGGDVTSNNGTGWITVERTRLAPDNSKAMTCENTTTGTSQCDNCHNYIEVIVVLGVIAGIGVLAMICQIIKCTVRDYKKASHYFHERDNTPSKQLSS